MSIAELVFKALPLVRALDPALFVVACHLVSVAVLGGRCSLCVIVLCRSTGTPVIFVARLHFTVLGWALPWHPLQTCYLLSC